MAISIAKASVFITELLEILEDLYWESPNITVKNQCFNVIRLLQQELTELTKISVQDHHYDYEIIASSVSDMDSGLADLSALLVREALRIRTKNQLTPLLEKSKMVFPKK
ncbi:MAG: hypothetical protein V7785_01760 [Bermanella sp.]